MGDTVRGCLGGNSPRSLSRDLAASLCVFPVWIFRPFLVLNWTSQWSHWNASSFSTGVWLDSMPDFLFRNSCLRFAFLLRVDGLFLGPCLVLAGKVSLLSFVSKEKVKVEPMVRTNLKSLPCFASAWQKSMHLVSREESRPFEGVVIVECYFWTMKTIEMTSWVGMSSLCRLT